MPLYLVYTMVQKVKNDQKLKSRGSCLKGKLHSKTINYNLIRGRA